MHDLAVVKRIHAVRVLANSASNAFVVLEVTLSEVWCFACIIAFFLGVGTSIRFFTFWRISLPDALELLVMMWVGFALFVAGCFWNTSLSTVLWVAFFALS